MGVGIVTERMEFSNMETLGNSKYRLTSQQISSNLSGEVIILDHEKGVYYGLDEIGALIWAELEKGTQTLEELCQVIMKEYEVEQETCQNDISLLLNDLIKEKLVEQVK
jgi:hypothetical protein